MGIAANLKNRKPETENRKPFSLFRTPYSVLLIPCSVFLLLLLASCENNIETIKNITNVKDIPQVSANDMEIIYSDSSHVKMKVLTKQLNKYNIPEKQYVEFPKGLTVYQYDSGLNITAIIRSNYAIYRESKKLWEARNDVVAKNMIKNEQLYTEELFWDQTKGILYSGKFTKIINSDGVFCGDGGFTAKEDMSDWKLIGVKGKVNVKQQDSVSQNP